MCSRRALGGVFMRQFAYRFQPQLPISATIINQRVAVPSSWSWTPVWCRGVKTTSTIHPQPVHQDDEKVLEKVLQEREKSEDLPETMMTNPYERPRKMCILCKRGIEPNYKNIRLLYQFVSPHTGTVYGRHITGLCKDKQEKVEHQINLAVNLGMMSNFLKEPEYLKDPQLCDPERPVRAHKY